MNEVKKLNVICNNCGNEMPVPVEDLKTGVHVKCGKCGAVSVAGLVGLG